MNKWISLKLYITLVSLLIIATSILLMTGCILDSSKQESDVRSVVSSISVSDAKENASTDSNVLSSNAQSSFDASNIDNTSNTSVTASKDSKIYQDIIDQLDSLEDVIVGLDGYTSSDVDIPTP